MLCGLHAGHVQRISIGVYRSSYRVHRSSRTKEMLFQAGVFLGATEFSGVPDWHEIVLLLPLHLMPV